MSQINVDVSVQPKPYIGTDVNLGKSVREVPAGGTEGQILTKEANGYRWANPDSAKTVNNVMYDENRNISLDAENIPYDNVQNVKQAIDNKVDFKDVYTKQQTDTLLDKKVDKEEGKGLSSNDFTDAEKEKLAHLEPGGQVNKIEKITVNHVEQPIIEKTVNIKVPTKNSQLINDSDYQSGAQVKVSIQTHNTSSEAHLDIREDINNEAIERKAADTTLQEHIDAEAQIRSQADTQLQTNINIEATTRSEADTDLQNNINTEAATRASADTYLQNALSEEATTRETTDLILGVAIDTESSTRQTEDKALKDNIDTERFQREGADAELARRIGSHESDTSNPHDVTKAQVGLGSVENRPMDSTPTAESLNYVTSGGVKAYVDVFGGKIDSITVNGEESALPIENKNVTIPNVSKNGTSIPLTNNNFNVEVPTKTSDITNDGNDGTSPFSTQSELTSAINTHDTSELAHAYIRGKITAEATTRAEADTALGGRIDTEAQTRSQADTTLQSNIDAEATTRSTADTALGGRIDTEEAARIAADNLRILYADIIDNTTTAIANKVLSANMGKELQDQINNLKSVGRFLSNWNAVTGLPTTDPTTSPYTYHAGDYYLVSVVSTADPKVNYRPVGATYTKGVPSTTQETKELNVGDYYVYDSTQWILLSNTQKTVTFQNIAGSPYDNANLSTALNSKVDKNADITAATHTKITYDAKGLVTAGADLAASDIPDLTLSKITDVTATATELNYSSGVTSNIQTQLNNKSKVTVAATGTSTDKVQYITIDGVEKKMGSDDPTEYTTKLEDDLYTYVNIGKITGASQTNPVKVADAGDPLKDVFNAILGTEVDVNPTINQGGTTFTKSAQTGTTSVSGAEIGQSISAQTGTVTYYVTTTATCSYGLKAGTYDTYNKKTATTFNYPIKTRTISTYSYQIRIKYPVLNGCTLSVTTGTLVYDDTANRYLYCNVDANNKVTVSIAIPANTSTASAITRFNQLEADVDFDPATYQGVVVDNFWTYLKASYTATGKTHAAITGVKSTAYTITAGTRYAYSKVTSSTTIPTSSLTKQTAESTFQTNGADFSYNLGDYIYLYRTVSGRTVETFVLGQWASVTFNALPATTITQANGATCTYYPYRVGPMEATGSAKYRV